MFAAMSNASKFELARLVDWLQAHQFGLIDCQVPSPHLQSLGAEEVDRTQFMLLLQAELRKPGVKGKWTCAMS